MGTRGDRQTQNGGSCKDNDEKAENNHLRVS